VGSAAPSIFRLHMDSKTRRAQRNDTLVLQSCRYGLDVDAKLETSPISDMMQQTPELVQGLQGTSIVIGFRFPGPGCCRTLRAQPRHFRNAFQTSACVASAAPSATRQHLRHGQSRGLILPEGNANQLISSLGSRSDNWNDEGGPFESS
jgi:hypothetical protein